MSGGWEWAKQEHKQPREKENENHKNAIQVI